VVETLHPSSLQEALALRARTGAIPLAGGTDLMVRFRRGAGALPGFTAPVLLLDRCAELTRIDITPSGITVGSMVTLARLADFPPVHPALRDALLSMGGPALRTVATLGGNICNASPAADTLPFLYAFDATVTLGSSRGERVLPIHELITGPGRTALRPDELLLSVFVPGWQPSCALWRKVGTRKANALTKVSIAAFAECTNGRVGRAAIALGAVAPTVVRVRDVESALIGAASRHEVSLVEPLPVRPIDDQRSTALYRQTVASNLVASFLDSIFR
jgi:CO/xanthine dehydrogenase FAD-binding subunit